MNEQLVKLKTSINNDVISKFDLHVLEELRFVPIDIQNNTLFAVISADSSKDKVSRLVMDTFHCTTKYYQVSQHEFNDFLVALVQDMVPSVNNGPQNAAAPRKKIGEILIESGAITDVQLIEALAESKKMAMPLGSTLYSLGFITLEQLKTALHKQQGYDVVTAEMMRNQSKYITLLPEDFIKANRVIPISSDGKSISVGMVDPGDTNVLKDIVYLTGQTPKAYLMTHIEFQNAVNKYFSTAKQETRKIMKKLEKDAQALDMEDSIWDQIEKELQDSSGTVAQLVNKIISDAIESHASDIHIEPRLSNHIVRYRIDCILR